MDAKFVSYVEALKPKLLSLLGEGMVSELELIGDHAWALKHKSLAYGSQFKL